MIKRNQKLVLYFFPFKFYSFHFCFVLNAQFVACMLYVYLVLTICHVLLAIYFVIVYIDIPFITLINAHNCTICFLWTFFPRVFNSSFFNERLQKFLYCVHLKCSFFPLCVCFQYSKTRTLTNLRCS